MRSFEGGFSCFAIVCAEDKLPSMRRSTKWIFSSAAVLGVGLIALIALGVALFSSARRGAALYGEGVSKWQSGDENGAIACFDAALQKHLSANLRSVVLQVRGQNRKALGDSDAAMRDYDEAVRLSPKSAGPYAWRGILHDEEGEVAAALQDYSSSLRFNPNLGGVLSRRGRLYFQQNDLDNAIADFGEAIRAEPDTASIYAWRAVAYERKGDLAAALLDFESALRLKQKIGWIYFQRGALYERQGRLPEAVADYSEAIRLEPGNKTFLRARVTAHQAAHRTEEELADLTELLRIDPRDDFALEKRALALAAKGDAENALPAFDDWVRFTQSRKARESRSRFLVEQDDFGLILRGLRQEIAAGWVKPFVHVQLAWLLATCPDPAIRNGREAVAEATQACEETDWKEFAGLDALAAAHAEAGNFAEAERFERQALETEGVLFERRETAPKRLALYQKGQPYHETPRPKRAIGDK